MSDLTKCATEGCPSEVLCWRKQAPSSDLFQSYSLFDLPSGASRCSSFWPFVSSAKREEIRRIESLNRDRDDEIIPATEGGAR
jgi:hypothetical protein